MKRMKNHKNAKNGVATLALCLTVGTMYMINPVTVGAANKRPVDLSLIHISHDIPMVEHVCDRIVSMDE